MPDDALDKLAAVGDRYKAAQAELEAVRGQLDPLIADAIRAGVPDLDIMVASGIRSRYTIRAIRDAYNIPPRQPGRRKRTGE